MKHYEILMNLCEIASEHSGKTYTVTDFAFGFIPFVDGENVSKKVGTNFVDVARWLLDEMEK